ncbi:sulfatase-like hydrolase/transferase [Lentisphaera profundi]|uniref:Sulfatase-like hydrolase/transferase n=1 Tax=Lentisphaera profundi TaxID=1658616 RepID=A0ABY7VYV6_9BACT|nr:sulfatase-like hydrolase/transferase [Lentisphaera profundi]WDE98902.1 sulfatase-like hydrolase/transferase [Lentisphaera profundi]
MIRKIITQMHSCRGAFIAMIFMGAMTMGGFTGRAAESSVDKPNIIFIMLDDLGKEWVGCYGAEDIKTPNIDALAAGGMIFNNAYSMPSCTPSRTTVLSGKYPWRTGWTSHWDVPRWGVAYFDWKKKGNTTFASLMKANGYSTCAVGKWQINDFRLEPHVLKKHGFDDWAMWTGCETGNEKVSASRNYDPYINTPAEGSKVYKNKFIADVCTDYLINYMRQHKDEPMCLYYPMPLPHPPLVATPDEPKLKTRLDKHRALVRYVDKCVGQIVNTLDELKIRDRTIIIISTDNGTIPGITGTVNGLPVRGEKGRKSERGVCAPFIVNGPGLVPAGIQTDALTDFSDLLPTFLELAGGQMPEDLVIDGKSFAPLILGKAQDSGREWIMSIGESAGLITKDGVRNKDTFGKRVIRDKQHKVWVSEDKQIIRLHDLNADPLEKTNLLNSELVAHKEALMKFQAIVDSLPDKDAHRLYTPRAANPWDMKLKKTKN